LLLAAALLCRASTVPLVLAAALLLMPMTRKSAVKYLWPLGIAAVVVAAFVGLNGGGAVHATVGTAFQTLLAARNVPRNLVAFFCYQALTGRCWCTPCSGLGGGSPPLWPGWWRSQ